MKRSINALVIASAFALLLSGCGKKSGSQNLDGFAFWAAPNTLSVMMDQEAPSSPTSDLSISCVKGEVESAQLIIQASKDAKSFFIQVSDFVNEDGDTLSKENVEILVQRYIRTTSPSVEKPTTAPMYTGYYPDALIPYAKYTKKQENVLYEGDNQGIWFNVNVPASANPGNYKAEIKITIDGASILLPFSLKIYDLEMTKEAHQMVYYGLWYDYFKRGIHIPLTEKTFENYYWFLAKKRATPGDLPLSSYRFANRAPDIEEWVSEVVKYAQSDIVPSYNLPCSYVNDPTFGNIVDEAYLRQLLTRLIDKNIELASSSDNTDLFRKAYIYAWRATDEPGDNESEHARIKKIDNIIVNVKAELASKLDEYPELKKSFIAIRNVVTTSPMNEGFIGDDVTGGVQTWCPYISTFQIDNFKEIMEERRSNPGRVNGEDFWWYNCVHPENPYPSYQLDDNLLSSRVMHWMKYDYGVSGNLYWCVNFWRKCINMETGLYKDRDIWNDPASFERAHGDGYLIYPGADYGLDEPIGTIRLESIREGSEDYEYLYLFNAAVEKINTDYSKTYDTDKILRHYFDKIANGTITRANKDFETQLQYCVAFEKNRTDLLDLLEKMERDPSSSFSTLDRFNR